MDWLFRLALVVHVAGILWLISAITLQLIGTMLLWRANTIDTVRSAGALMRQLPKFFGPATALIIISGLYMSWVRLDHNESIGWIVVSIVAFIFMAASGQAEGRKADEALKTELQNSHGEMTDHLQEITHETAGLRQGGLGVWIILGIVVLMIYKPNVPVSIAVIVVAALIGLGAAKWLSGKLPRPQKAQKV
jgi:hypothetical protein